MCKGGLVQCRKWMQENSALMGTSESCKKSRGGCQRHRNGTLEAHHQDDDDIGTHDTAKTHYTKILSLN